MSVLPVCVVLLSYALVKGCAGAIQCYTCDDCRVVNDTLLQICPPDAATVAVALTTTTRPEELSTRGVRESTAAADVVDPLTEAVVNDAGKDEEAEAGGAEAGEAETGEAEAGGAEAGEAEPAEAVAGGAETGEAEAGEAEAGGAEAGEADPAEAEPAEAEAAEGEDPEPQSASLVLSPDFMSNLNITRRKRESTSKAVSYHCFSVERDDGGQMRTKKGCIAVPVNASACAILKEKHEASDKNCRICSQDKCNSGVVLKYSLTAALLVVVNSLLQW